MRLGRELVAGERMADQDRIAALVVQPAIGLIGDGDRRELDAAVEANGGRKATTVSRKIDGIDGAHRSGSGWRRLGHGPRQAICLSIPRGVVAPVGALLGHLSHSPTKNPGRQPGLFQSDPTF